MMQRRNERASRRAWLAVPGLGGAVALAGCPPPDADYQHVAE